MSPVRRIENEQMKSFPRVSGDEPSWVLKVEQELEFSPRERG